MKKAVDVLCQCRETLMYTYVFAYYLKKSNHSCIFEVRTCCLCLRIVAISVLQGNQADLEMATECLSEYLERELTSVALTDLKIQVQDKTK